MIGLRSAAAGVVGLLTVAGCAVSAWPTPVAVVASPPTSPPAAICGDSGTLTGPVTAPPGSVTVPVGDNSAFNPVASTTYWFSPGTHTFGASEFGQIIPADSDTFIGAPGAVLDGGHVNRYAFTQHAQNVTIKYLTIQNFGAVGGNRDEGVVNHDAGHNWTISNNTVTGNAGAGVFIGTGDTVRDNCLSNNGQYGFSAYEPNGVSNITLTHNEITGNNTYDWEAHISGCGCTGGGKFWATNGATISNNWSHDNHGPGFWADTNNNDFLVDGNYINNNDGIGIEYEISYNAKISNNTLLRNALRSGSKNPGFPEGGVYLSESGGDNRVPARYTTIDVVGNQFTDNWSGVVLWENADRFCGSPANTSSGTCTLVNPTQVNLSTCIAGTINNPPYYADCRWKTQNVNITGNTFSVTPANIPGCTPHVSCGFQGLFSNYGTYPTWSPYMGEKIEQAITFDQNNHWSNNVYTGPWQYMAHDQGVILTYAQWQAAPYGQDTATPPPTSTTPPPPAPMNALDTDTATLEGGVGHWTGWYSETPTRATAQAHTGAASLKILVTAPYGWGAQLNNWPGVPLSPGARTVSFWARAGSAGSVGKTVTVTVHWKDAAGNDLLVTSAPSAALSTTWRQATATVAVPFGTVTAYAQISGTDVAGGYLYLDDFFVG